LKIQVSKCIGISANRVLGIREQVTRHRDHRNCDKENPEKERGKVNIDCFRFQGFKRPTLDHQIREGVKSDLPSAKRGSSESLLWVQISR
jgi:hypothetical protein